MEQSSLVSDLGYYSQHAYSLQIEPGVIVLTLPTGSLFRLPFSVLTSLLNSHRDHLQAATLSGMLHEMRYITSVDSREEHGGPASLENAVQVLFIA